VKLKKIEGITALRDESDKDGMRIVFELRRGEVAEVLLNQLYKLTQLQTVFGINMVALINGQPRTLGLMEILNEFIKHRREVVVRRTIFELKKARDRAHILEGLAVALANIEERDGVVVFVNRENPDDILSQTEKQTATVRGFDIETLLKVGKNAAVTIVIDEQTGDNFKVSGEGDFIFTMKPNGRMTLTGGYEITSGHYELNLYNLVNRKFLIAPGSRVTWSGDPFDAKLNVRAIYNLETSASALMAPQISGADPSVKNKYRQVLPFSVY